MGTYLHVLEGRIRIKVAKVKGDPKKAYDVERQLRALHPSIDVKANPTTGNVLLLFDPDSISKDRILELFRDIGYLPNSPVGPAQTIISSTQVTTDSSSTLARRIVEIALQAAIERLIFALI